MATGALATGPGGWDHLGDGGSPSIDSLNRDATALSTALPGQLLVGGKFTDAGGDPNADQIATWDGTSWNSLGPSTLGGDVYALAYAGGKVFAGGSFTNAGGNANADFLAVWDGASWQPFCNAVGPAFSGNVKALQVIGGTLYVGGEFQNAAGIASADYLLACNLATGASSSTVDTDNDFSGAVYALTADSNGTLYAAGTFINLDLNPSSDSVASYSGGIWQNMGSGPGPGFAAVTGITRSLTASGTNVYIGTDALDVGAIPQADHVARWDGAAWHAVGSNSAGTDGFLPPISYIYSLLTSGSHLYVAGSFQNAGGDPTADNIVDFDGTSWHPVGSNGAGDGPLPATVESLAIFGGQLHAGGNFTTAGGDTQAAFIARFDTIPPETTIRKGPSGRTTDRTPTFKFKSDTAGATFECSLDAKAFKPCTSPKTYKRLSLGRHKFEVAATDQAGNTDPTAAKSKFKIVKP